MDEKSRGLGVSPEELARLLNLGSDTVRAEEKVDQEQKKAKLLHDWLAATLPLEVVMVECLSNIFRRLCGDAQQFIGKPFGDLLTDPRTDILAIEKIKDYSKKLAIYAKSETGHDAAIVIYYAAIASALIFHNCRITKLSYESLRDSFSSLTESEWLTVDLIQFFKRSFVICQNKVKHRD